MRSMIVAALLSLTLSVSASERVDALLSKMTLEEKVGQLLQVYAGHPEIKTMMASGGIGAILNGNDAKSSNELQNGTIAGSRLKIPLLIGFDVIHGYRTIFPIPLAMASAWDPDMIEEYARIAAREARAAGIHWTFSPMVDIARDPRWGRVAEGAGEDPFLGAALAKAYVRGYQGNGGPDSILACAKHYAAYGAAIGGRDYGEVEMSEGMLREVYLPPFHAAAEAGAATFMSAFNSVGGVPATANPFLLDTVLRKEWKFDGMVVSDWTAVEELLKHGVAGTPEEAARKAITAGVDMDMVDLTYRTLVDSARKGLIAETVIDQAARRVLVAKERAGLFDRPYTDEKRAKAVTLTPENRTAARRAAQRSIVLLKNDGILPLPREGKQIAFVGALSDSKEVMLGPWAAMGKGEECVSVLDALRTRKIAHTTSAIEADIVVAVVGETRDLSGEASSRSTLDLPGQDVLDMLAGMGKPVITVVMSGRPLAMARAAEKSNAVVQAWFPGTEGGNAIVDILYGDVNPSAKLPITIPRTTGQVPIHYAQLPTGRPGDLANKYSNRYIDLPLTPLYPFGFGLSYTKFEYSDLRVTGSGPFNVSANIKNGGAVAGDEIVQLYIRDRVASVSRPVRELKGFRRVSLAPGETKRVEFTIERRDLQFWNNGWVAEPGTFDVWIAPDSASGLQGTFELR